MIHLLDIANIIEQFKKRRNIVISLRYHELYFVFLGNFILSNIRYKEFLIIDTQDQLKTAASILEIA